MKRMVWMWVLAVLMVVAVPVAWSQEEKTAKDKGQEPAQAEKKEEPAKKPKRKESKIAGTPYIYSGPDTGAGFGGAIIYRDLGNKIGRDTNVSADYTSLGQNSFSMDWTEPDFIRKGPQLSLHLSYDNKPSRRFYGIGNDADKNDICNFGWTEYRFRARVTLPQGNAKWRARIQYEYQLSLPKDGSLNDPGDWRYSRPISQEFPALYNSNQFNGGATAGPGLYLIHDTVKDKFPMEGDRSERIYPISGGYQQLYLNYNGPAFGSRFEYERIEADVRQYFGFFKDNTVVMLRSKGIFSQGDVPFWNMPAFGSGNNLRGFYDGRFRDLDSLQYNIELRQGIAPNFKWPLFGGVFNLTYPFVFLFFEEGRVFDSYTQLGAEWNQDYHPSYGAGFRFVISPSVVVRFEWAYSPEFPITFGSLYGSLIVNTSEPEYGDL